MILQILAPYIGLFLVTCFIVLLCSIGILLCCLQKRRKRGVLYAAPVIVTSTTTHQVTGSYPVTAHPGVQPSQQPYTVGHGNPQGFVAYPMPQPQPQQGYPPMPQPGYSPYQAMNTTPYPPAGPGPHENMNPPSYDQVVSAEPYQKQSAYNPNYSG